MAQTLSCPGDTIAAIATPAGRGGIGVVRVSGPAVPAIAEGLLGRVPVPRQAELHRFLDADGTPIDQGLALYFPAPRSFTGEDVLELHGHGGPVVMDLLLARVLALGARPAAPGEFSRRAFLNDKLDLAQAEAIADLIDSATAQAARAAARSLTGDFSDKVKALAEALTGVRVFVEAAIDFPEEEIDFLQDPALLERLAALRRDFDGLEAAASRGRLLREGLTLVIVGRPNAGKSSLLNALAGYEAAIVTDLPGTTRDLVREQVQLDGIPLHLIDTAGLREGGDIIEREGMRRAWASIEQADRVLLVIDDSLGEGPEEAAILDRLPAGLPCTRIYNKIDLTGRRPDISAGPRPAVSLSARTGTGLELLHAHLKQVLGLDTLDEGHFTARRRHLEALQRARGHLETGWQQLSASGAGELLAEELRLAQQALGEITGAVSSDDLLGRIFATFCIGK